MKKTALLVFPALIAFLLLFIMVRTRYVRAISMSHNSSSKLQYYFNANSGVSVDPVDSDQMGNAILMKHLIGTLVRYGNGGQFEPYLAESFRSSDSGKLWKFKLLSNLKCQDGEMITPQGYIEGFSKILRAYAKQGPIPILSDLEGWDGFLLGKKLGGLNATANGEIEFRFSRAVGSGFLEYLSMPYYGYLCASNFNEEHWKKKTYIVSSGPYALVDELKDTSSVEIFLREDWALNPTSAPKMVVYRTTTPAEAWKQSATIVQASLPWDVEEPPGFKRIWGPPDIVRAAILNDRGPSRFFANHEARALFRNTMISLRGSSAFKSKHATLAQSFYSSSVDYLAIPVRSDVVKAPKEPVLVYLPESREEETRYAEQLVRATFEALKWRYRVITPSDLKGVNINGSYRQTHFDTSLVGVVAGSVIEPWTVNMMFCSTLGVTFPDPSSRICQYVKKLLSGDQSFSIPEAGADVSRIVHEDAGVIPIYHGRTTWYFSNDLDLSKISGDLIIPRFEDIGQKDR